MSYSFLIDPLDIPLHSVTYLQLSIAHWLIIHLYFLSLILIIRYAKNFRNVVNNYEMFCLIYFNIYICYEK